MQAQSSRLGEKRFDATLGGGHFGGPQERVMVRSPSHQKRSTLANCCISRDYGRRLTFCKREKEFVGAGVRIAGERARACRIERTSSQHDIRALAGMQGGRLWLGCSLSIQVWKESQNRWPEC